MNRVRLLPLVIVAVSGLLVLRLTILVTDERPPAAPPVRQGEGARPMTEADLPQFGRALSRLRLPPPTVDPEPTGATPKRDAKVDAKGDAKKEGGAEPAAQTAQASAPLPPSQPLPPAPMSASERAVLDRLQERRGVLEERQRELELRENLLKAAERKLDDRVGELKQIESRVDASARAEREEADRQIRTLVTMYESMKPKDAARIFDRLNIHVLMQIATTMNPRRMSEILAVMTPEAAERLTVALATRGRESVPPASAAQTPAGELPRIDSAAPAAAPRR